MGEEKDLKGLIQRAIEAIENPEGALDEPVADPPGSPAPGSETESAPAPSPVPDPEPEDIG